MPVKNDLILVLVAALAPLSRVDDDDDDEDSSPSSICSSSLFHPPFCPQASKDLFVFFDVSYREDKVKTIKHRF
jgi:hypothetical protein